MVEKTALQKSNERYDFWRFICDRLLPALGTLYFAISQFIPLPYPEVVVGVITALTCFGDEILAYFKKRYKIITSPQTEFSEEEEDGYEG